MRICPHGLKLQHWLEKMSQVNILSFLMTLICSTGLQSLQGESHMLMNDKSILFGRGKLPFLPFPLIGYFDLRI